MSSSSRCWTMCMKKSCWPSASIGLMIAAAIVAMPARKSASLQRLLADRAPAMDVPAGDDQQQGDRAGGERPRGVGGHPCECDADLSHVPVAAWHRRARASSPRPTLPRLPRAGRARRARCARRATRRCRGSRDPCPRCALPRVRAVPARAARRSTRAYAPVAHAGVGARPAARAQAPRRAAPAADVDGARTSPRARPRTAARARRRSSRCPSWTRRRAGAASTRPRCSAGALARAHRPQSRVPAARAATTRQLGRGRAARRARGRRRGHRGRPPPGPLVAGRRRAHHRARRWKRARGPCEPRDPARSPR